MTRNGLVIAQAVLLAASVLRTAAGQICTQGRDNRGVFPFLGLEDITHSRNVTVYVTDSVRDSAFFSEQILSDALARWNSCSPPTVPEFVVDWTGTRPTATLPGAPAYLSTSTPHPLPPAEVKPKRRSGTRRRTRSPFTRGAQSTAPMGCRVLAISLVVQSSGKLRATG